MMQVFRNRWVRRVVGGAATTILVIVIGTVVDREWSRSAGTKRLDAVTAGLDQADPDWRWDQLNAKRPKPPEGRNGAELIPRIKAKVPDNWDNPLNEPELKALHEQPANLRYAPELIEELRKCFPRVKEAAEIARTIRDCPFGRREIALTAEVLTTRLEDTQNTRVAVNVLKWDVAMAIEDGDRKRAAHDLLAMMNVSRSLGDEPFLISQLVRIACRVIAMRTAEQALGQGELSADGLAALQASYLADSEEPLLLHGLRGERAAYDRLFSNLIDGTTDPATWREVGDAHKGVVGSVGWWWYRGARLIADRAEYLDKISRAIETARLPADEQVRQSQAFEDPPFDPDFRMTKLLYPAVRKVAEAHWRSTAELRCAAAALACERYRQDTGKWPGSLEAVVPKYLPAVPRDPFDGAPLRFKREPDGIVIYSLGVNRTDDGGDLNRPEHPQGLDAGFRLWDVNERRKTAPFPPPEPK